MRSMVHSVLKVIEPPVWVVVGLTVLMLMIGFIISDDFGTINNLTNIFDNSVSLGLVALGQSLVILTAGIDLSVGGIISLTSSLTSGIIDGNTALFAPVVLGVILLGTFIGFLNGALTVTLRVHPLIITLGMSMILQGVTFIYTLIPPGSMPLFYDEVAYGRLFGVPIASMVMVVIYALMFLFLRRIRLGRHIYAVGGNVEAAKLSGIKCNRVIIFVYAASGFFAALAGLYLVSRMGIGDPKIGDNYMLASITPVVVGGTILSGGKGNLIGTLIGVFLILIIRNLMNFMDITSFYQWIVEGVIIVLAVSLYVQKR